MAVIPFGFWSGQQSIITSNLIFYYDPANPNSYPGSGTTLTDLSGNAYTATLVNGVGFNSTDGGGSFTFDGTNDYISVPNGTANGIVDQSFTIEAWLKPSTSPPTEQIYFSIMQTQVLNAWLHLRFFSDGRIRLGFYGDDLDSSSGEASFGSWQYISMRYRSSDDTSTIFKNGTQIAQNNAGPLANSANRIVKIGMWDTDQWWKGSIGAIYAYQAALTDSQITSNYDALKSRYGL